MKPQYSKQAAKTLNRMDASAQKRIREGISGLPKGDVKIMQGYTDGRKRLRIGGYRVVFKCAGNNLQIMEIGSRGDIYK